MRIDGFSYHNFAAEMIVVSVEKSSSTLHRTVQHRKREVSQFHHLIV